MVAGMLTTYWRRSVTRELFLHIGLTPRTFWCVPLRTAPTTPATY